MRILVTGASGMMGSSAVKVLSANHEVFGTGNSELVENPYRNYLSFNLLNQDYKKLIEWSKPDVIIHCAALTNGNYCDNNPLEALDMNGNTLNKFLKYTNDKVKIIYISSDAVFKNELHNATEKDCTNPDSTYGKSKELGEFFLRKSERNYCILRTTIVGLNTFSSKQSFAEWIISSLKNGVEVGLFDDVLFNPISIWDLIKEIDENIMSNDVRGVYHVSGREVCTKYQFGVRLAEALSLDAQLISKSSIQDFKNRAKRSSDQTLCVDYYSHLFNRQLPDINQTINEIKINYNERN